MKTNIILRILYLDTEEGLMVLLDEDYSLPSLEITSENLDVAVNLKLRELLFSDHENLWKNKVFSSIENDSESIRICFNLFLYSKTISKKPLFKYNKNSIDLQRFINHSRK